MIPVNSLPSLMNQASVRKGRSSGTMMPVNWKTTDVKTLPRTFSGTLRTSDLIPPALCMPAYLASSVWRHNASTNSDAEEGGV